MAVGEFFLNNRNLLRNGRQGVLASATIYPFPQHFLYFLPLPHGQASLRPIFGSPRT
jgi:hypothetical protein